MYIIGISGKIGKLNICGICICWEIFEFLSDFKHNNYTNLVLCCKITADVDLIKRSPRLDVSSASCYGIAAFLLADL